MQVRAARKCAAAVVGLDVKVIYGAAVFIKAVFRLEPDFFGAILSRVVYLQVKWCIVSHHIFRSLAAVIVHGYGISFSVSREHFWRNLSDVGDVNTRPRFCLPLSVH